MNKCTYAMLLPDQIIEALTGPMGRVSPPQPPATGGTAKRLVVLESPFVGDITANIDYARTCVRDSVLRGEAPIASHLLFTQPGILADADPAERALGIAAGLAWLHVADASVVYTDRGISSGMRQGIAMAQSLGKPIEYRSIGWKSKRSLSLAPTRARKTA